MIKGYCFLYGAPFLTNRSESASILDLGESIYDLLFHIPKLKNQDFLGGQLGRCSRGPSVNSLFVLEEHAIESSRIGPKKSIFYENSLQVYILDVKISPRINTSQGTRGTSSYSHFLYP